MMTAFDSDKPFVSVIVPVYNDAQRLGLCLESLARQSYPAQSFEETNAIQRRHFDVEQDGGVVVAQGLIQTLRRVGVGLDLKAMRRQDSLAGVTDQVLIIDNQQFCIIQHLITLPETTIGRPTCLRANVVPLDERPRSAKDSDVSARTKSAYGAEQSGGRDARRFYK